MKPQERSFATVVITREDNFAIVTLNRPDKLNALSPELLEDLIGALREIASDATIRAVIITGAGRAFSAGGDVEKDITPLREKSPSEFDAYVGQALVLYKLIIDMEKPVIAAINGHAVGAGLDLALSCDIRIAAQNAQLGELFVRMGLTPESGIYLLPRLIGTGKAKLLSFTGDLVNAERAEQMGLVEQVVSPDELMSHAKELARRLANGPTKTIAIIKKAIDESLKMTFESSMDYVARLQYQLVHTEDHKEATVAWLAKRAPVFRGK